jgi:hypothetical protein
MHLSEETMCRQMTYLTIGIVISTVAVAFVFLLAGLLHRI